MNNKVFSFNINFSVILRYLRKNIMMLLIVSITAGTLGYIAVDWLMPAKYTATVDLSVIANENLTVSLASRKIQAAITRYINILSKDVINKKICEDLGIKELPGTITIESLYGSSIISVDCVADSPRTAFEMMQSFRENYQKVASQFNSNYSINDLGTSNVDSISTSETMSALIAVLIFLIVMVTGIGGMILVKVFDGKVQDAKQADREIDALMLGSVKNEKKKKDLLISHTNVSSAYMEAIKKAVIKLLYQVNKKNYKTILITSALESEGKSTISANIALTMAEQGKKVLLIDADLRGPVQYKIFKKENVIEFADFLEGKIDIKEAVELDRDNKIACCFTGTARDDADELLENGKIQQLLEEMGQVMDYIIIDTAPAGITRDAEVLSAIVDAAVLVVHQEKAKIGMINDVIEELEQEKMEVVGFVLNDAYEKVARSETYNHYYGKDGLQTYTTNGE